MTEKMLLYLKKYSYTGSECPNKAYDDYCYDRDASKTSKVAEKEKEITHNSKSNYLSVHGLVSLIVVCVF